MTSVAEEVANDTMLSPTTPAHQLRQLEHHADELRAKHAALRVHLVHAITAAAANLQSSTLSTSSPSFSSSLPLPDTSDALVDELASLHAARQYLQYLQELQALTRHAEKLLRSAERAYTAGDPGILIKECSDAVDAFSHAMGYAIALQQMQDDGFLGTPALLHHGQSAIGRVTGSGTTLSAMLNGAAQHALQQCNWPPPLVGGGGGGGNAHVSTITATTTSSAAAAAAEAAAAVKEDKEWAGFAAAGDFFTILQHIFILQLTLQRTMQHKAFSALETMETHEGVPLLLPAEELVQGIAVWLHHHFASGLPTDRADRPEWLFAASLKAAKQCAPAAEELQSCVDAHQLQTWYSLQLEVARAVGSVAVASILRGHVLPRLGELGDAAAWLHFVDEAIAFERNLAPLRGVVVVGGGVGGGDDSSDSSSSAVLHAGSVLEVIFEYEGWAQGWLTAEREDAARQIDAAIDAVDAWMPATETDGAVAELAALALGGGIGGGGGGALHQASTMNASSAASNNEFYPPVCAEAVLALITGLARRQSCLYSAKSKSQFTLCVLQPTLKAFRSKLSALLVRAEQFQHLLDDAGLPKVGGAICAAHFLEHHLREPQGALLSALPGNTAEEAEEEEDTLSAVLDKEAASLATFRRQWAYKLAKIGVDQFQKAFGAYVTDLSGFSATVGEDILPPQGPSPKLLPAADGLQHLLRALSFHLDAVIFRDVWKAVALAVNYAIFNDIATEAAFSAEGASQLDYDVDALIGVFSGCTSRPAAHFKESKEACLLLSIESGSAAQLMAALQSGGGGGGGADALASFGIKALNGEQATSVLYRRIDLSVRQ